MENDSDLNLDYQPVGRLGMVRITARFSDGSSHTDKIDVALAKDRLRFICAVANSRKGLDKEILAAGLEKIAADLAAKPNDEKEQAEGGGSKRSQADILVKLAEDAELFHTPGGHDSEGYATIQMNGHAETWPISGKAFKRFLGKRFYDDYRKAPGMQAIQDAVNVIAGRAIHEGSEREIAVRLAQTPEGIYLDLSDDQWRAVQITSTGWKVVTNPPISFIRKRGMLPLPIPVCGAKIDTLRNLVNVPDDDAWKLFVAWLVAALRPGRPFPILAVNGEQGSAKSTLCKMARALIDPNAAALRRPPREERDMMIAATNGWVVAFDNLSGLLPWLSDALCTLATGGGFSTRELYTDDNEKLFEATRPIIINGIEDLGTRSDLLDRSLTLTLAEICDRQRRDENELWTCFYELRPLILGALLDAVAAALRNLSHIKLIEKPRMADFAAWIAAAEPALGWQTGGFLAAYSQNRGIANSLALETSIIAPPILALMDSTQLWQGTSSELLANLEAHYADDKVRKRKEWPTTGRKLLGELRRLARSKPVAELGWQ